MAEPSLLVTLTADLVAAYVAKNRVQPPGIAALIATVHGVLVGLDESAKLTKPAQPAVERPDAKAIARSITPDRIISFEDGKPYKALRRHLTLRGLTPEAYKAKWGLPVDYPLVAASYSARRSELSREIRSGRRRAADMVPVPE